jgi:hypothetical protein
VIAGLTIVPEVNFATGAADVGYLIFDDPSRGKFDTGKLAAADYFTDVAEWFRAATITRGTSRFEGVYGRAEAGTMTLDLANEDRRFDPTNLAGPYVSGGATQIKAGLAIRLRAVWASVAYDLFRGFITEPQLRYLNPSGATTTFLAADGTEVLSNFDQNAGGVVGTGEDTGARINRVADNAGWPAEERNIAAGKTTVQGTDLSANAWAEIVRTSDTELGEVYFDTDGKLTFRHRHAIVADTRSNTPQAIFGDGPGELGFVDIGLAADLRQTKNIIRLSRVGGTQQVVEDVASQAQYRKRTWQRSDLLHQTDAEVLDYARHVLALLKDNELRIESVTIDPLADPANLFPQVLGRKLGDRVTVKFTPPGGGARISRDVLIRGIEHTAGIATWRTRFVFQDATKFAFFVFDNPTLGRFDANAFAY